MPSYQRVLRLDIMVLRTEGSLKVKVEDHDYEVKKEYYEQVQP